MRMQKFYVIQRSELITYLEEGGYVVYVNELGKIEGIYADAIQKLDTMEAAELIYDVETEIVRIESGLHNTLYIKYWDIDKDGNSVAYYDSN